MLTGMPHEQDIPAPVTTTTFLLFATPSDKFDNVRLVGASDDEQDNESVVTIALDGEKERRERKS